MLMLEARNEMYDTCTNKAMIPSIHPRSRSPSLVTCRTKYESPNALSTTHHPQCMATFS